MIEIATGFSSIPTYHSQLVSLTSKYGAEQQEKMPVLAVECSLYSNHLGAVPAKQFQLDFKEKTPIVETVSPLARLKFGLFFREVKKSSKATS